MAGPPELVPPVAATAPEGFAVVDEPLVNGLPHRIQLGGGLALVVILPTGVLSVWRDSDPTALVSSSDGQAVATVAPSRLAEPALDAPPLRLLVESAGATIACQPPVLGLRRRAGTVAVQIEFVALGWRVHAGTVRGSGDFGSRLQLAWRAVGET